MCRCYCVVMTAIEPQPEVTDEDVVSLLRDLRPGSTHPAADLYVAYVATMEAQGRPVAHKTVLGRALGRAGCKRKLVRRGSGPRGRQVRTETHCWVIPGATDVNNPDDPINILVRDMGEGFHLPDAIHRRYLQLTREKHPLTRMALMTQLGYRGYPPIRENGRVVRYFHLPREN